MAEITAFTATYAIHVFNFLEEITCIIECICKSIYLIDSSFMDSELTYICVYLYIYIYIYIYI